MKPLTTLLTLAALATAPAHADFYDGQRGPSTGQIHYTLSSTGNTTSHNLALKYFGRTGNVSPMAIGAINSDGSNLGYFGGVGAIIEGPDQLSFLPIVGYNTDENAETGTAHFVGQATLDLGTFVADQRYHLTVPAHGQDNHIPTHVVAGTLSVGNARVRFGIDGNYVVGQGLTLGGLVRYDLDTQDHTSWLEVGIDETAAAQLQFRGNL